MYEHLIKFPHVKKNYKYFIGYLSNDCRVKPVHIALSKTSACVKSYDGQTKWMYFFKGTWWLIGKIFFKKLKHIKKEFDSKPVCNKYGDEATGFHDNESLSGILIMLA